MPEPVFVGELNIDDPGMWENEDGPKHWWAISDDEGIKAYAGDERTAKLIYDAVKTSDRTFYDPDSKRGYEPSLSFHDVLPWLLCLPADKRSVARALYNLMMNAELDDLSDRALFYERDGRIGEMATALGRDVALVVEAHFFLALRLVTHMKSGKPYVQRQ
jgi:hypothetical protein